MNEALVAIKEVADGFLKRIAELEVENAALKVEVAQSASHNSAMDEICPHYYSDRMLVDGETSHYESVDCCRTSGRLSPHVNR